MRQRSPVRFCRQIGKNLLFFNCPFRNVNECDRKIVLPQPLVLILGPKNKLASLEDSHNYTYNWRNIHYVFMENSTYIYSIYLHIKTIMFITRKIYVVWWKSHSKIQQIRLWKCINYSSIVMWKIKWQAYARMEVILIYACPVPKFLDNLRIMALIRQRHFVWSGVMGGGVGKSWRVKREHPPAPSPLLSLFL